MVHCLIINNEFKVSQKIIVINKYIAEAKKVNQRVKIERFFISQLDFKTEFSSSITKVREFYNSRLKALN